MTIRVGMMVPDGRGNSAAGDGGLRPCHGWLSGDRVEAEACPPRRSGADGSATGAAEQSGAVKFAVGAWNRRKSWRNSPTRRGRHSANFL